MNDSAEPRARVLLMGYRAAVGEALEALGVPYVVWSEADLRVPPAGVTVHRAPYGRTAPESRRQAEALANEGPFSHVIACTESSVVAASHARRVLGTRLFAHTTAHRCHDKLAMKTTLREHDVAMTDFADGNRERSWSRLRERLGSPLVVKNRKDSGGSGIDIACVGRDDPPVRLRNRIVERFVDAPEASVESFVVNGAVVFENVTEYYRKRHVNIVPAPGSVDRTEGIRRISRRVIEAFRVSWGVTHMEAFLCPGGPLFGEVALRPPGGYIMDLIGLAYGFDAWRAFVSVELGLPFDFPAAPTGFAAAVVLHPGAGRVTGIRGRKTVRAHPNAVRVRVKVKRGEFIDARRNVGKNVGHVLLRAPDRDSLLAAIDDVERTLEIDVDPTQ
jgi:biotin carboxylase